MKIQWQVLRDVLIGFLLGLFVTTGGRSVGLTQSVVLSQPQAVNLTFTARGVKIANPTGFWVFISVGGNNIPSANAADIYAPPYTYVVEPMVGSNRFGLALSTAPQGLSPTQATSPVVTFYESDVAAQVANISNPNTVLPGANVANINSGATPNQMAQIIAPIPGVSLQVFRIQGVLLPSGSLPGLNGQGYPVYLIFWDGVGVKNTISAYQIIWSGALPQNLAVNAFPMADWTPHGNKSLPGQGLYFSDLSAGVGWSTGFILSVLYTTS